MGEAIEAALTPVGTKYRDDAKAKGEDPEMSFMVAKASSDLSGKIRDLTALESLPASGSSPKLPPKMLLIDIPSNGAFYVAPEGTITAAAVEVDCRLQGRKPRAQATRSVKPVEPNLY